MSSRNRIHVCTDGLCDFTLLDKMEWSHEKFSIIYE